MLLVALVRSWIAPLFLGLALLVGIAAGLWGGTGRAPADAVTGHGGEAGPGHGAEHTADHHLSAESAPAPPAVAPPESPAPSPVLPPVVPVDDELPGDPAPVPHSNEEAAMPHLEAPPVADRRPHRLEAHGDVRIDDYFWLRGREDADVHAYLNAENAWLGQGLANTGELQSKLFDEIVGRIKKDDRSVPYKLGGHWYYTRYEEGQEYPIYCRRPGSMEGPEQVLVDANARAAGHDFYAARAPVVASTTERIYAWAEDTVGRRIYTVRFADAESGLVLADTLTDVTGNLAWANDDATLFYSKQDPTTLRSHQIWKHRLGTVQSADELVFEETDETFAAYVWKSKSKDVLFIGSFQTVSTEMRYLDANTPDGDWTVLLPRERDHEYSVQHHGPYFYFRTNRDAKNFKLVRAPMASPAEWQDVVPHRPDVLLEEAEIFSNHLVLEERTGGLTKLRVRRWDTGAEHVIDFGEPAYAAWLAKNPEFDSTTLRYGYTSMTTPRSVFDYDLDGRTRDLLKQDEIVGGYPTDQLVTQRLHATAPDGTQVPISIVYRKDRQQPEGNPTLLYGYGSYGHSLDAGFNVARLSLLDRGFAFAIAHVRGGEDLGRPWYEDGKLLNKRNTFTDFIACGEHLVREGFAAKDGLYAMGGSAGGLLMGAVMNMQPDLWAGVVASVPFVDVVTTMLDDEIPLTTGEFDEWGNPAEAEFYAYMKSYSPYDNVAALDYPPLLVTTGLHDSQVQYWEPAKWVAKLRALRTNNAPLYLKTNMDAGHGGRSGRFRRYEEVALEYAFLLDLANAGET